MKKQYIVKDKDKLFKKLFISPSYCEPLDPPLLVSPDFINLLLQQSSKAERVYQLQIINDILNVFAQRPTNSLLLCAHDQAKLDAEKCIFDSIVLRVLNLISNEQQVELYLERIVLMLSYYRINLQNFRKLTQWLSKMTYIQKFNPIKLMFIIRLIKLYYSKKLGQSKSPFHYFYLFGTDNSGIQPIQHASNQLSFKNQLTIVLSFNSQGQSARPYNLFLIKTEKNEQIGLTYTKGTLKIAALHQSQFLDQFVVVKQLQQQVWYRIIVNLNTSHTQCIFDNQTYTGRALIKKQRQRKIIGCMFGREFFGMIGNVLVSNKNIPLEKLDMNTYPYGIDSIDHLIALNKTSIPANSICSCLPFYTFEVREVLHCFDVFHRNHSAISDNIVTVGLPISEQSIQHLGGCSILLPLFYLARFYNKSSYPDILQDLLSILSQILSTYNLDKLETQFQETSFLQILGQHLGDIPHLQTSKSLNIILAIFKKFKRQKTKLVFLHDVIWNLNVGIQVPYAPQQQVKQISNGPVTIQDLKSEAQSLSPTRVLKDLIEDLIAQYYKTIITIHNTQKSLGYKAMSFAQITYWAVQRLQANRSMIFACCLQHHLNQTVVEYQMKLKELIRLDSSHYKIHYHYLQEILSNYIQNQIRKNSDNLIEDFKTLLRLLLQKYSACFYVMILKIIKRQIITFGGNKQICKVLLDPKLQITSFLVFLSEKTINPDIISQILYILLFIYKHSTTKRKEEVIKFIVNLLKINQQMSIKITNPMKNVVARIRKNSYCVQHTQYGQQQQNQVKPKRRNSFGKINQKNKLTSGEKQRLSRVISRSPKPERISSHQILYNVIMNQLTNTVSQSQPTTQGIFYSEQSILILKQYYKIAQPIFKQSILLFVLASLQKNPQLKNLKSLTLFLLQCLKQSIYASPQETKNLLTIFTCIFSQIIINHGSIIDYYSSIKYLKTTRVTISLVLPHVLSKIIKLADMSQLCQLLMVCLCQIIESPQQSALEMSLMVIGQINDKVLNLADGKNLKPEDKNKLLQRIQKCQLFNQTICESLQKQTNIALKDPFQYISEDKIQFKDNVDFELKNVTNQLQIPLGNEQNNKFEQVKIQQVSTDQINGIINKLNMFTRKQQSKSPRQDKTRLKKQSSRNSNNSMEDNSSNKSQKQKNIINLKYVKKVTALQIYIKLFFKTMQKLQSLQQKDQTQQTIEQKQSLIRRSESAQIAYSYQFKSQQILTKQFTQIILIYLKSIIFAQKKTQKGFIKFLLSYLLYKNQQIRFKTSKYVFNSSQLLTDLITNTILPFISEETKDLHDLTYNLSFIHAKTIYISYFTRSPFKFKFSDFIIWNNDKSTIENAFKPEIIKQIFFQDQKFNKFFHQIQDNHDLLIVGFYQKNMQKFVQDYENLMSNFNNQAGFRNVQKLFDTENAAQQKTRITFLYENQCRFRKYHYQWDKLWNKLRTYHQPYGFWMAQKSKDLQYTYPKNQIRNFKFQMSQYSSEMGLYPVLQAKILQPWTIVKDHRIKKNLYINSFSQMMKPSHIKIEKTQNQNQNNIFTNMWKGMLGLSKKNSLGLNINSKQKVQQYEVVLISRSTKATGKLFIQNKQDLIFCYQGARQEDTHLSFQKFSLAFNRETYQKWSLYNIQKIKIHRYLLKYQALQVIFCDGRSVIFNFVNDDKEQFIKQIEKIQKQKMQSSLLKLYKFNKVSFLLENFVEYKGFDQKITQSWIKRQISNLEYLTKLNRAASRGIFDLSQYMVVPWVVQFKKQKQPTYRDLSKTMGGLGSQQRKKIISQKYFAKDPFNPYPPFFFGTHYSSPGVVFNFLIRLSPFTQYCKHLQGGKFDIPDRLFSSIVSAWRSASEEVSDVRELIPQMYYLPQMYINIDENYFGLTQNAELINHIEIPPWGANNPYFFTSQLRQIMQSQQVSQKINEWIDLIFGYKQRGKQAESNYNIYYYLTYQDHKDVEQEDDVYVKSKQAQIVHFGQIPPQLFDKPHPKRNSGALDGIYQLRIIRSINLMNSLKQKPIGLRIINSQLFICKRNQFQVFSIQSNPAALQKKKKFNFEKSMTQTYYLIKKQKSNVYLLEKPYFIVWGYMSNQFRIFNKNTGQVDQSDEMPSKILSLHVNKNEDLILIGSQSGIFSIYQIQYSLNDIFIKKIGVQVFPAPIVHISEFDGFFAITFGNYSAIYKINRSLHYLTNNQTKVSIKFFRSFYNSIPLKASYIMTSPLYSIILIDNANIKSYSINGQFIKSINSVAKYYGRFKDSQLHDVFYAVDDDKIICFSIPDLRNISILQIPECEQVLGNYILYKSSIDQIGFVRD